ncbi:Hypothetical predicted protein, partial [Pelobates cultripes]
DQLFPNEEAGLTRLLINAALQVFVDLSPVIIQQHRMLSPITSVFQHRDIHYRWYFPIKLLVLQEGSLKTIKMLDKEKAALAKLIIDISMPMLGPWRTTRGLIPEWQR